MKAKASTIAQKLLNLYRQEHVIIGGWAAVNPVFVNEAEPDVIEELRTLPTGRMLIAHIENLRSGKTSMDSIERDLMPYGGLMNQSELTVSLTNNQIADLEYALNNFTPDQEGLDRIQDLDIVKKFGDQWIQAIRAALVTRPDLTKKWDTVAQTYQAYHLWNIASQMVNEPISERARAQLQADMPEYETYLPMFGNPGTELLAKLRTFISTREPIDTDNAPDAPQSI